MPFSQNPTIIFFFNTHFIVLGLLATFLMQCYATRNCSQTWVSIGTVFYYKEIPCNASCQRHPQCQSQQYRVKAFLSWMILLLQSVKLTFYLFTGSKDHIQVQGKILEGLVARIVSHECSQHMEEVLRDYPPPPVEGGTLVIPPASSFISL